MRTVVSLRMAGNLSHMMWGFCPTIKENLREISNVKSGKLRLQESFDFLKAVYKTYATIVLNHLKSRINRGCFYSFY